MWVYGQGRFGVPGPGPWWSSRDTVHAAAGIPGSEVEADPHAAPVLASRRPRRDMRSSPLTSLTWDGSGRVGRSRGSEAGALGGSWPRRAVRVTLRGDGRGSAASTGDPGRGGEAGGRRRAGRA